MKTLERSHDTGLRIIEILKILLDEDANKKTIINKLKCHNDIENVYTNEAYLKYFNTLSMLGLNVLKLNDSYVLKNALIHIELTHAEEEIFLKLIKSIPKLNDKRNEEIIKRLFLRVDKYVDLDIRTALNKKEHSFSCENLKLNIINTLKQTMLENSEITITFKKRNGLTETLNVAIKKIIEEKSHYYIMCYNPTMQRCKRICVDSILDVKRTPRQLTNFEPSNASVVYEVYGRLAKSYKIKEWETLDTFGEGFMRIINKKEDFETLIHRLLKYGENCKILSPTNVVNDFLELTKDVLANLEETECQQ